MRYKIVSQNEKLITKAKLTFNLLDMKEAIHIQELDFYLVDVKTLNKASINTYKNKISYCHILFIVNNNEDIKLCLDNGFSNFIKINFSKEELLYWCKYFLSKNRKRKISLVDDAILDISKSKIIKDNKETKLSSQELLLLLELSKHEFTKTTKLVSALNVNSQTTIRTIISRIRKKLGFEIFELNKGLGYKLLNKPTIEKKEKNLPIKQKEELEEQNRFLQSIIDSSSIFVATFIHKQLFCINKAFRGFLGEELIKELWQEENGEFFKLFSYQSKDYDSFKNVFFKKGVHKTSFFKIDENKEFFFEVETLYFENLDKHLLVFKLLK